MRQLLGWLAVLALLGTVAGCYRGRGVCDCLDYRDPCMYGCYSLYGPPAHMTPMQGAPAPEPLKVKPKEIDPEKPPEEIKDLPATLPDAPATTLPEPPALSIQP